MIPNVGEIIATSSGEVLSGFIRSPEQFYPLLNNLNIDISGEENLANNPCIFAATHFKTDWRGTPYDGVIINKIISDLGRRLSTVVRIDPPGDSPQVLYTAFREGLMRNIEWIIPIYTNTTEMASHREMIESAKKATSQGNSILIFPWGECLREYDFSVDRIHSGAITLARLCKVPIIPTYIRGPEDWGNRYVYMAFGNPFYIENRKEEKNAKNAITAHWITEHSRYLENYSSLCNNV